MRKTNLVNGEYYHIFNRGVDKRNIFVYNKDWIRFFQSIEEFNSIEPIGSIYENSFNKIKLGDSISKSSAKEYFGNISGSGICEKEIILGQFNNQDEYKRFAESSLDGILERRDMDKMLLE